MKRPSVVLVLKRSTYSTYVEEGQDAVLKRLLDRRDPTVSKVRASHEAHERTVAEVQQALREIGADVRIVRGAGRKFDASGRDLVVTVGGDGTLLGASHSVANVPVLAINSAPHHSVGFFCGARSGDARRALERALRGKLRRVVLTRMKVSLNGRVVAGRILNDALFCHALPAATSRYILELRGNVEEQKSSGFWIGPAAGSTAAQRSAGGRVLPLASRDLQLVVREPYTPHGERYRLRRALVEPGDVLVARSKNQEAKVFLDGPSNSIDVRRGDVVEFASSEEPLVLLGIGARRSWGTR